MPQGWNNMTDLHMFFALSALKNKLVFGADISNTFAEANAPAQEYFMCINTPSLTSSTAIPPTNPQDLTVSDGGGTTLLKHLANGPNTLTLSFASMAFTQQFMHHAYIMPPLATIKSFFLVRLMILPLNQESMQ
jgi:hypothetical protein